MKVLPHPPEEAEILERARDFLFFIQSNAMQLLGIPDTQIINSIVFNQ